MTTVLFMVCAALINFHISFNPLRDQDTDMSSVAKKKFHAVGIYTSKRKRAAQSFYGENWQKRLWRCLHRSIQPSNANDEVILGSQPGQ